MKGTKYFSLIPRAKLFSKLILIHYFSKPEYQKVYKDTSSNFKKIRYQKQFKNTFKLLGNLLSLSKISLEIILNWNKIKDVPFEHAKYAPILFKHRINSEVFTIFQTLEMVDFSNTLKKESIDTLIKENGLFIAHTYFSVPMAYHSGRMILNNKINPVVEANFKYLSEQIQLNKIWNPTLKELAEFLSKFEELELDINSDGAIYCINNFNFNIRTI